MRWPADVPYTTRRTRTGTFLLTKTSSCIPIFMQSRARRRRIVESQMVRQRVQQKNISTGPQTLLIRRLHVESNSTPFSELLLFFFWEAY